MSVERKIIDEFKALAADVADLKGIDFDGFRALPRTRLEALPISLVSLATVLKFYDKVKQSGSGGKAAVTPVKQLSNGSDSFLSGSKTKQRSDNQFTQPVGDPTGFEAKLLCACNKLLDKVRNTELKINGRRVVEVLHNMNDIRSAISLSYDEIRSLLLGHKYQDIPNPSQYPDTNFKLLKHQSETMFQTSEHFQSTFIKNVFSQALDLHSSGKGLFHMGSSSGPAGEEEISNGAKPDAVSMVLALLLELKSDLGEGGISAADFEVLLQALERLLSLMDVKGHLTRAFCFAVSSRNAYLISYERCEEWFGSDNPMEPYESFNIIKMDHADVCKVWCLLTNTAAVHPRFFLSEDARALQSTFEAAGMSMQNCRIRLSSCGTSPVYAVTFSDSHGSFPLNNPTLAIKINYNLHRHDSEVNAQERVVAVCAQRKEPYYVLGICTLVDNRNADFKVLGTLPEQPKLTLPDRNELENCVNDLNGLDLGGGSVAKALKEVSSLPTWISYCRGDDREFGSIIMLPGRSGGPPATQEPDLKKSFKNVKDASVWHADYRSNNVMYFPSLNRWFIIDFDLSICHDNSPVEIELTKGSPRAAVYDGTSKELVDQAQDGDKVKIRWDATEEATMFCDLLHRLKSRNK